MNLPGRLNEFLKVLSKILIKRPEQKTKTCPFLYRRLHFKSFRFFFSFFCLDTKETKSQESLRPFAFPQCYHMVKLMSRHWLAFSLHVVPHKALLLKNQEVPFRTGHTKFYHARAAAIRQPHAHARSRTLTHLSVLEKNWRCPRFNQEWKGIV